MADYKTPGVYVEEISTLPPSVAAVATAIPAFIGYTEKASRNGKKLKKYSYSYIFDVGFSSNVWSIIWIRRYYCNLKF